MTPKRLLQLWEAIVRECHRQGMQQALHSPPVQRKLLYNLQKLADVSGQVLPSMSADASHSQPALKRARAVQVGK